MVNKLQTVATGCAIAACVVVGTIVLLVIALGLAIESGHVPDTAALPAGKIPRPQLRQLEKMGVTKRGENVLYFYSSALFDIEGDGNLFTDRRVISYQGDDGDLQLHDATYDEIESIDFERSDSWVEDSIITVTQKDGDWFVLTVSTEGDGDRKFYDRLKAEWDRRSDEASENGAAKKASDDTLDTPAETDSVQ